MADDDLSRVLTLLHESGRRWRTLYAEGDEWSDPERRLKAFLRMAPPGSVVSSRGTPGPADRDPRWKVWVRQPHQSRTEFGLPHGYRHVTVANGHRMCASDPGGGYRITDRREEDDSGLGPAGILLRPFPLLAALDLRPIGEVSVLGRRALAVAGLPRPETHRRGPSLTWGADELRFALDAERGVLLWLEHRLEGSAHWRLAMTSVAFDGELDDDLFALPERDGAPLPFPPEPGRPPRPGPRHPGPPDHVLGQPVPALVVVARKDSLVVAVDRVVAYPDGFELGVTARTGDQPVHGSFDTGNRRSWSGSAAFPGQSLKVRLDANLTVVPVSGTGTQTRFDQRLWVTPLPPPEPVGVVVEWPSRDLPETRAELDGAAIVEAAARAETLWP